MPIGTQGLGTFLESGGGGGGGGATIIADGGTIGGTYSGDVYCEGTAYLDDNVAVQGDLICVNGPLYNFGSHALQVAGNVRSDQLIFVACLEVASVSAAYPMVVTTTGDHGFPLGASGFSLFVFQLVAGEIELNGTYSVAGVPADNQIALEFDNTGGATVATGHIQRLSGNPQSNIEVAGDFITNGVRFLQFANAPATVRVGGNLIGANGMEGTSFTANGYFDSAGANLIVYGDLTMTDVNLNGGDAGGTIGGNGGNATIYGDLTIGSDFSANGGRNDSDATGGAGNGGSLTVWGNTVVQNDLELRGGNCVSASSTGNAGNGGTFLCYGDATVDDFFLQGGVQENGDGNGGNGGSIDVYGSLTADIFELGGGNCTSSNPGAKAGDGGYLEVFGDVTFFDDVNMSAGDRYGDLTGPGTNNPAHGGRILIWGNCSARGDYDDANIAIYLNGGFVGTNPTGFDGGNGGLLYVSGNLVCEVVEAHGGSSGIGYTSGNGGTVRVGGSISSNTLYLYGAANNEGNGGNGGVLEVDGSAQVSGIEINGGYGVQGSGGYGGRIEVRGDILTTGTLLLKGGDCTSINEANEAGHGGDLEANSVYAQGNTINLSGGARSGATTAAYLGGNNPYGGSFNVRGTVLAGTLNTSGGNVTTDYPGQPGGNAGTIVVEGPSVILTLNANGGNSVGNNGGLGGNVTMVGPATVGEASLNGGAGDNSTVGGDAGTNGPMGNLYLAGGITASVISALDGAGPGAAPTDGRVIELSGNCLITTLNVTDRADVLIRPADSRMTFLKVEDMPGKSTLNDMLGNTSASLTASLAGSVFFTGVGGTSALGWYSLAGTDLFAGP